MVSRSLSLSVAMAPQQNLAERSMAVGLRALNWLAASDLLDRLGLREPTERFPLGASKTTAPPAASAGRTFPAIPKPGTPARPPTAGRTHPFDRPPPQGQ